METPKYIQTLKEAGISVSDYDARRYRQFLLHLDLSLPYIEGRMVSKIDKEWAETVSEGSDKRVAMEKQGAGFDDIVEVMAGDAQTIFDTSTDAEKAQRLAAWMRGWVGEPGLKRMRSTLNGAISYKRKRRHNVAIQGDTHARLLKLLDHVDEASNLDDLQNMMITCLARQRGLLDI